MQPTSRSLVAKLALWETMYESETYKGGNIMFRELRNTALGAALAIGFVALSTVSASTQDYPTKPINFVVGFSAGGFADSMGRILAQGISERLGQPVVVENKGGGSGNIAAASVAASDADGYTVLVTTASLGLSQSTRNDLEYKISDLTAVAIPVASAETLAAHPSVPATNLAELIAWAKTQDTVTLGNAGVGTGSQVTTAYFLTKLAGLDNLVEVGYKGGSNARQAAISGEVQLIGSSNSVYPVIREGLLNGIAIASDKPNPAVPGVATYEEQGYKGFLASSWVGLFVPAGTDAAVQEALNAAVNDMLDDPAVLARFEEAGVTVEKRDLAASAAYFVQDADSWTKMVTALGIGK